MQNFVHTYWTNGTIGITWKYFQNDVFGRRSVVSMHKRFTIKELPNGFPCLDIFYPNTRDVARLEKSVKKHEPLGDCFQLFESRLATSQVFGSEYPNTENH